MVPKIISRSLLVILLYQKFQHPPTSVTREIMALSSKENLKCFWEGKCHPAVLDGNYPDFLDRGIITVIDMFGVIS